MAVHEAYILTNDVVLQWLPEQVIAAGDFDRVRARAERRVVNRYRQDDRTPSTDVFDAIGAEPPEVQLDGWREDDSGNPDVDAMDDRLVEALRDAVAQVIEWTQSAPDRRLALESRGSRSSSTRDRGMPPSVYEALRPYDERTPLF